uniref:SFRICE_034963 n=1 Tax=Spodoptera frugiperda TaxID=7108 RepID=A0A2H1WTY9_SPOFR
MLKLSPCEKRSLVKASIFSLQDQAIVTRQHERDVLKRAVDGKCRLCGVKDETAQHIVAGCEQLAGTYYTRRHNNVVQYVYWTLLKKTQLRNNQLMVERTTH